MTKIGTKLNANVISLSGGKGIIESMPYIKSKILTDNNSIHECIITQSDD